MVCIYREIIPKTFIQINDEINLIDMYSVVVILIIINRIEMKMIEINI
jgi:hypothetical protein